MRVQQEKSSIEGVLDDKATARAAPEVPAAVDADAMENIIGDGRFQRLVGRLSLIAGGIAGLGYLALMFLTITDVTLRETGSRGILGSVETIEVAMAGLAYLGMSTAEMSSTHVRTPMLTNLLPKFWANISRALTLTISSAFIAWLTYENLLRALASTAAGEHRYAVVTIPVWPARIVIVIGLVLFLIVLVTECVRAWARFIHRETALTREMEGLP